MINKDKIKYFVSSAMRYFEENSCPYCNSDKTKKLDDTKYLVTRLYECKECKLKYRHPKDSKSYSTKFYNGSYKQSDGITTDLPNDEELEVLIKTKFGQQKNASRFIELIKVLFPDREPSSINLLDFGANWGYTSFQFKDAGFNVTSYEISENRASFGNEKLGLNILTKLEQVNEKFDVFFSSHVMEHLHDIKDMFNLASKVLKKGGYFVAFCPNGSEAYRKTNPKGYQTTWGMVHPNYISDEFLMESFEDKEHFLGSWEKDTKLDEAPIKNWMKQGNQLAADLSHWELFFIAKY